MPGLGAEGVIKGGYLGAVEGVIIKDYCNGFEQCHLLWGADAIKFLLLYYYCWNC